MLRQQRAEPTYTYVGDGARCRCPERVPRGPHHIRTDDKGGPQTKGRVHIAELSVRVPSCQGAVFDSRLLK